MHEAEAIVLVLSMAMFAGVSVLWLAMLHRRKLREMEHRERMAMIQAGLMPAPESDPYSFELQSGFEPPPESATASRWRSGGIFLVGLGLGLMMLLTFTAGEPEVGIGVGGGFALLGAAFVFNAMLSAPRRSSWPPPMTPQRRADPHARPAHPTPPPPNVGP